MKHTITLYYADGYWQAMHSDPETKKLFPPHGIVPTAFRDSVDSSREFARQAQEREITKTELFKAVWAYWIKGMPKRDQKGAPEE